MVELLLKVCHLLLWPHMLAYSQGRQACLPASHPRHCTCGMPHLGSPDRGSLSPRRAAPSLPPASSASAPAPAPAAPCRRAQLRHRRLPRRLAALPGGLPEAHQKHAAGGPGGQGGWGVGLGVWCGMLLLVVDGGGGGMAGRECGQRGLRPFEFPPCARLMPSLLSSLPRGPPPPPTPPPTPHLAGAGHLPGAGVPQRGRGGHATEPLRMRGREPAARGWRQRVYSARPPARNACSPSCLRL